MIKENSNARSLFQSFSKTRGKQSLVYQSVVTAFYLLKQLLLNDLSFRINGHYPFFRRFDLVLLYLVGNSSIGNTHRADSFGFGIVTVHPGFVTYFYVVYGISATDGKSLHHFAATIKVTPLAVSFMSRTARIVSSVVVAVHPHADHQLDDATAFELVKPVIIRGKGWRFTMKG
ncbi:hypothetical protein EVAR_16485_1 [Eumeta japonica]|uniref:Uncharacterized protein n=1 Tax=Eumeta variegata TaxID=151549 RepID=A0A4C1UKB4_EUMVA|nr:hypothetical protein EVAR_16485_1 [Eumeta japonica]